MALPYKIISRANPLNRADVKQYASAIHLQKASKRMVEQRMSEVSGMSIGEAKQAVDTFWKVVFLLAKEGYIVPCGDYVSAYLNIQSEGVLNPQDVDTAKKRARLIMNILKLADKELEDVEFYKLPDPIQ